jgi:acyl-CoA dehydrogenase
MASGGGNLKRREKVTGRFADIFSWMYLGTAVLRRFEAEGRREEDLPFLHWTMQYALAQVQGGFDGLFQNLNIPGLTWLFRGPVSFWSRLNPIGGMPPDALGGQIANALQTPGPRREALTRGIYVPSDPGEALGRLERAFVLSWEAERVADRIKEAVQGGRLPRGRPEQLVAKALDLGVINPEEARRMQEAEAARDDAIQVDAFTQEEYMGTVPATGIEFLEV